MGGLKALINSMPNVLIVPFVVHNNYQIFEEGTFPLNKKSFKIQYLGPLQSKGLRYRYPKRLDLKTFSKGIE